MAEAPDCSAVFASLFLGDRAMNLWNDVRHMLDYVSKLQGVLYLVNCRMI